MNTTQEHPVCDKPEPPRLDRQPIAVRVAELLLQYHALQRWREMVRMAWTEADQRHGICAAWVKSRQEFFERACEKPRGGGNGNRSPSPGTMDGPCETERVLSKDGQDVWVRACPPPELRSEKRPPTGSLLPVRRPLSLADCYTILAAIHDASLQGVECINPWSAAEETTPLSHGVAYQILLDKSQELPASEAASLGVALLRVEADLHSRPAVAKIRGHPRLSPLRLAKYRDLKEHWERAKSAGVSKEQFCEDQHLRLETLETALRTCRKQPSPLGIGPADPEGSQGPQ